MDGLAAAFMARFAGLSRAHGRYGPVPNGKAGEKLKGKAETVQEPVTLELWQKHLGGVQGLGIVPIRDDNTCVFGALDIDVYDLDISQLAKDLDDTKLPLVPCRTKSGGIHLYLFTNEEVPAELMVGKLMEWSTALGFSGCEVFPKQTQMTKNSIGNWINVPYFNAAETLRYALGPEGQALTAEGFLARAEALAVSELGLHSIMLEQEGDLEEGPPCLQTLSRRGFPAGSRNNALFNLAVYARKRYPDGWEKEVERFNAKYMDPPKEAREVSDTIKSCGKKTYAYKCNDLPIVSVCNRQLCLTRKFGVGGSNDDPGVVFGDLIKLETDPPIWLWSVNGRNVEMSTEQLLNPRLAQTRIAECVNVLPRLIKKTAWDRMIQQKLSDIEIQTVPPDATTEGQWEVYLGQFCTGRGTAAAMDEILLGRPYTEAKENRTYFRSTDFLEYLKKKHVAFEPKKLYNWMRKFGVRHHTTTLKGKFTNLWSVPRFSEQTQEHAPPRGDQL